MQGFTFYYMDGRRIFTYAEDINKAYVNIGVIHGMDKCIAWHDFGLTNTHWFDNTHKCWNKKQVLTIDRITLSKLSSEDIGDMLPRYSCIKYTLPNEGEVTFYELIGQITSGYIHGYCLTSVEPKTHPIDFGQPNQYWCLSDLINGCHAFKLRCCGSNSSSVASVNIEKLTISS